MTSPESSSASMNCRRDITWPDAGSSQVLTLGTCHKDPNPSPRIGVNGVVAGVVKAASDFSPKKRGQPGLG